MSGRYTPCLDCEERCLLCHKRCFKYKEYRKNLEKIKMAKKHINERFVTHYMSKHYGGLYG